MTTILEIRNIKKTYMLGKVPVDALCAMKETAKFFSVTSTKIEEMNLWLHRI